MSSTAPTPSDNVAAETASALKGKEGVCRIEVSRVDWIVEQPWQRAPQTKSSGTGFVISGERILTNAHVVRAAVDIRVRLHGSTRRFPATVTVYAPDVDLALLDIVEEEKDDFFQRDAEMLDSNEEERPLSKRIKGLALEFADDLPALQESVHVVGFPTGGRTICITEGVVSRIDLVSASTWNNILAIQIDAAINPGNSGGPAFNAQGQVTGVAFCKNNNSKMDNVGYLIPADVVRAFLGRISENNIYTLSPAVPYRWHPLENKSLRLYHKVPEHVHGVLLVSVCESVSHALQEGDVLTMIDGKSVADDGQVCLRGDELIQHRYMLRGKRVDEPTVFTVFRKGQQVECTPYVLEDIPSICLRWASVDYQPDFLILGALVLLPLSWSLRSSKKCGTRLVSDCVNWCQKWPSEWEGKEGLVVLTTIFSHELSFSYSRPWRRVTKYNDTSVLSLEHLRNLWQKSCTVATTSEEATFARIELEDDDPVIFEVKAAMAAQSSILDTHQIPLASKIHRPNPKYKQYRKDK